MKHKDVIRSRVLSGHPAWLLCVLWVVMWGMWCICVRRGSVSLSEESDGIDRELLIRDKNTVECHSSDHFGTEPMLDN